MSKKIQVIVLIFVMLFGAFFPRNTVHAEEFPEHGDRANSWRYTEGTPIVPEKEGNTRTSAYHPEATLKGIDVSAHMGVINWDKVKASGIDFAILRCGYGMDQTDQDDKYFARNASECERLGIPYGVYLYSYATDVERASSEADHALRLIKDRKLSYPVYYDMEDNSTIGSDHAQIAAAFCEKIEAAGYPVGIYANLYWWNNYLTDDCFENWHRWVAQFNSSCSYQGEYAMWQYTSSGMVDGISGTVDMNFQIGYPKDHGSAGDTEENAIPMYRLYNPNSGEHFYTGSIVERDDVVRAGWNYEGIAFYAPSEGEAVHRLYNPNSGDHHYTPYQDEADMLKNAGWRYEGIAWYSSLGKEVPLYRLWNKNADCGSHHYTASTEERDWLIGLGWIDEGIGWYGINK